jgi:RimJ/RimL family protein N-acetyltransferase
MNAEPKFPTSARERLLSRAEQWIYRLNERGHWIFRLYDRGNEIWARIYFGPLRRRAAEVDIPIPGKQDVGRMRLLTPGDLDDFAALLASFDFEYLPPHDLDRANADRALRRRSYIPFGIFHDGELVGYLLLRLFFVKRAVLGIWSKASHQNRGFTKSATKAAAEWTRRNRVANYITVPLDNVYSLRVGLWAGWKILRSNSRFHVLLYLPDDS